MMASLTTVADLKVVTFPTFADARGTLAVAELAAYVDFPVQRLFWIDQVPANANRGGHAHKKCLQFMVCLAGTIVVEAFDGKDSRTLRLSKNDALLVPAGIFATESFDSEIALLLVLCDRSYDKNDYIHDHAGLLAFRQAS
jgi:dTDP-4-dehydrorhamnose 3,5-epimerase-like enzyme